MIPNWLKETIKNEVDAYYTDKYPNNSAKLKAYDSLVKKEEAKAEVPALKPLSLNSAPCPLPEA